MAHILVIDDEKNVRNTIRMTLAKAGHEVEVAEEGAEGLGKFGSGEGWDLILVDQRMPGMEGAAVIREARNRDPAARTVMITAFDTVELASEVIRSGATDFLRKPFSAETLRGAVAAALARPRQPETSGAVGSAQPPMGEAQPPEALHPFAGVPGFSYYLNGYYYWPLTTPDGREESNALQGFVLWRAFRVRAPLGEMHRCTVGVTPHIREQIRVETGRDYADEHPLWDALCRSALADYLWQEAKRPPEVLPVYQLADTQLEEIRSIARQETLADS